MQWVVERRYSDFRIFHKLIRARLPQMGSLPFPPKSYFFSRWASTIARRQAAFEQYLDVLLSLEPVPPELKDFLEVPLPNGRGGFRLSAAQLSISSSSSNGGGKMPSPMDTIANQLAAAIATRRNAIQRTEDDDSESDDEDW